MIDVRTTDSPESFDGRNGVKDDPIQSHVYQRRVDHTTTATVSLLGRLT